MPRTIPILDFSILKTPPIPQLIVGYPLVEAKGSLSNISSSTLDSQNLYETISTGIEFIGGCFFLISFSRRIGLVAIKMSTGLG